MNQYSKGLWTGIVLTLLVAVGCATTWKYYGEQLPARSVVQADVGKSLADLCYDEGKLLGKQGNDGWPDLPLIECKPDSALAGKCVVQMTETYRALLKDDEDCHITLSECEKGKPPTSESGPQGLLPRNSL